MKYMMRNHCQLEDGFFSTDPLSFVMFIILSNSIPYSPFRPALLQIPMLEPEIEEVAHEGLTYVSRSEDLECEDLMSVSRYG